MANIIEYLEYTNQVYTQYCLLNVEYNNSFERDFLSDIALFSASPQAAIYLGIMTKFTLEDISLWKKIRKQVHTGQIDIIEIEIDVTNINTPLQASSQNISRIEALKTILTNSTLPDSSLSQLFDNIININTN